jgi:hypothetical protein
MGKIEDQNDRVEELIERRRKNRCLWCNGAKAHLPKHYRCSERPKRIHAPGSTSSSRLNKI